MSGAEVTSSLLFLGCKSREAWRSWGVRLEAAVLKQPRCWTLSPRCEGMCRTDPDG